MVTSDIPAPIDSKRVFCVMLHDVTPRFQNEVEIFIEALSPKIGTAIAAGVVPCWDGNPLVERDQPFLQRVRACFGDLLLHGFTHTRARGRGVVSIVASGLDEMNGLSPAETDQRLADGQRELERWFGLPARGFIAPTFQIGLATPDRLLKHGVEYTVGYRNVVQSNGGTHRLATWCWDVSPLRTLCHAGYWLGELQYHLRKAAIPCLALHPLDLKRGFLPQIIRTVDKLIAEGRRPVLLEKTLLIAQ